METSMRYDVLMFVGWVIGFVWLFITVDRAEQHEKAVRRLRRACGLQEWGGRWARNTGRMPNDMQHQPQAHLSIAQERSACLAR